VSGHGSRNGGIPSGCLTSWARGTYRREKVWIFGLRGNLVKTLSEEEFDSLYERVAILVKTNLGDQIRMPRKLSGALPSKDSLVLVALYKYFRQVVSKEELTGIVRAFYPETNDVQQARHLGKQKGFWIESGTRGEGNLRPNDYMLVSLEEPYPGWSGLRTSFQGDFDQLKKLYGYRCATCGSKEGEPQFHNPGILTQLQAGHMDPNIRELEGNAIPQCGECNRAYRDWFIFDVNGRVRDINRNSSRDWHL
jgi:hypothetical protein